jgi:predicted dinucleotide-binding enzyme
MKYSIVGAGLVGKTLAGIFARQGMPAVIANSRGPESLAAMAAELGPHIIPATVNQLPMRALIAALPDSTGCRVVFVASDYEDGNAEVSHLAEQMGFAPIQVGKIAEGGRLIQARATLVFQNLIKYPM